MHHPSRTRPTARRARAVLALTVGALAMLAACGGNGGKEAGSNRVTMRLIAFRPETLSVAAGTTVTWTQQDAGFHTVTSGTVEPAGGGVTTAPDGRFDSGQIATDGTFRFRFDQPGVYPYFCSIHPATMRGEVRVT